MLALLTSLHSDPLHAMRPPAPARLARAVALVAVLALAGRPLAAQPTVYTDRAAFLAALGAAGLAEVGVDDFDDLTPGELSSPLARTAGSFGYTASASTTGLYVAGAGSDRWLSTNTATDVLTLGGFATPVRAIGTFLFGTDLAGAFRAGTTLTIRATALDGASTRTVVAGSTATFLGFLATTSLQSLTVEAVQPADDLAWPTLDGVTLAGAGPTSVVPEPGSLALLGAGLLALGVRGAARARRGARAA